MMPTAPAKNAGPEHIRSIPIVGRRTGWIDTPSTLEMRTVCILDWRDYYLEKTAVRRFSVRRTMQSLWPHWMSSAAIVAKCVMSHSADFVGTIS
jgi:hypothetical protein